MEGEQQAAFRMRMEYVENALAAHTVLGRGQQALCEQHASLKAHLDRLVDESVYKYIQRGRPQKVGDDRHVAFRERTLFLGTDLADAAGGVVRWEQACGEALMKVMDQQLA